MKLDDLKKDWQKTINTPTNETNLKEVVAMLEKETTKIDKEIKRRDIIEISIAVLLIPAWLYGLSTTVSLMQTAGYIIAIAACIYIPYRLIKAKHITPKKSNSIRDFLINEKQKVAQQKTLLESIVWWYLAPLASAIVLITLGASVNESGIPQVNTQLATYYGMLALLFIGVYLLNKRSAKKRFGPLLEQIDKRLEELANK